MRYYGLYTFSHSKKVHVMHDRDDKVIVSEDPQLIRWLLDKLQEENLIGTGQVVEAIGEPF